MSRENYSRRTADVADLCVRCGDLDREGHNLIECEDEQDQVFCTRCFPLHVATCVHCFKMEHGRSKKDAQNPDAIHAQFYTQGYEAPSQPQEAKK